MGLVNPESARSSLRYVNVSFILTLPLLSAPQLMLSNLNLATGIAGYSARLNRLVLFKGKVCSACYRTRLSPRTTFNLPGLILYHCPVSLMWESVWIPAFQLYPICSFHDWFCEARSPFALWYRNSFDLYWGTRFFFFLWSTHCTASSYDSRENHLWGYVIFGKSTQPQTSAAG